MRTLALVLVVALTAVLPGVSRAVQPEVVKEENAFASWSVPTGAPNHFDWYFAYGWRENYTGGNNVVIAGVGRGDCVRSRTKRSISIECSGQGDAFSFGERHFTMSPTASTARIDFRDDERRYVARWRETEKPQFGFYTVQIGCDGLGGAGGGILWAPRATGKMYGEKLTPKYWWDLSMTTSGGYVMECGARLVDRLRAGKTIRMTFTR
ncbi:MAG: hypothetical protein ACRDKT_13125 [Actinomycetota bacterium]